MKALGDKHGKEPQRKLLWSAKLPVLEVLYKRMQLGMQNERASGLCCDIQSMRCLGEM